MTTSRSDHWVFNDDAIGPARLPREAQDAVEDARATDRAVLDNDPFADCYTAGMQSETLPSRRRRKISLERREY